MEVEVSAVGHTASRQIALPSATWWCRRTTCFFQRGLEGCHPHGVQTKQAIPQCHRRRVSRHTMPAHMGGKRKKAYFRKAHKRLRSGYSRGRKRTKQVIFRSLFGPAPEVLGTGRVALPLVSGPTSGRRTENLSSGRVQGQAGGGGRSRLRTAWPTQGGTPPKRLRSVLVATTTWKNSKRPPSLN